MQITPPLTRNQTSGQILRVLSLIALALWLLPLDDLLRHTSDSPTILGRYSPSYAALLAVHVALALIGITLWWLAPRIAQGAPYSLKRLILVGVIGLSAGVVIWFVLFQTRTTFRGKTPAELYFTWIGWGILLIAALSVLHSSTLPQRLTWRKHGLPILASALFTLFMLEVLVRLTFPFGLRTETYLYFSSGQPNPWQPYTGIAPSADVEFIYQSRAGYQSFVRINDNGLRDLDYPYDKPPGVYRVLFLGDSMTQAVQVPLEETFQQRLETRLRADGYPIEILSGSMGGWGTANEALYLEYEGCRYQPDLVLVAAFPTNDVGNNLRLTRFWQIHDDARSDEIFQRWLDFPYFELNGGELSVHNLPSPQIIPEAHPLGERLGAALAHISTLYLALHQIMNPDEVLNVTPPPEFLPYYDDYPGPEPAELRSNGGVHLLTFTEPESPAMADAWRITVKLLERIQQIANDCGADMAVVILPSHLDQAAFAESINARLAESGMFLANSRFRSAEQHLASLVADLSIPYLNLTDVMDGSDQEVFLPLDGHFTSFGHEQAASALYDWLVASDWLP